MSDDQKAKGSATRDDMSNLNRLRYASRLFDEWPEKYDQWFETPIGALVKQYENELLLDFLQPQPDEISWMSAAEQESLPVISWVLDHTLRGLIFLIPC